MASFFQKDSYSSDSEDDDYVPDLREVSSDDEDPLPPDKKDEIKTKKNTKMNRKILDSEGKKNKTFNVSLLSECKVDEKQRANDLFKCFLEEVETEIKVTEPGVSAGSIFGSPEVHSSDSGVKSNGHTSNENTPETKSCELFDFAGETVSVSVIDGTKIVSTTKSADSDFEEKNPVYEKSDSDELASQSPVMKRKGLQSVLSTVMNKKKKLTILEKSSLDWNLFKKEQGISDELKKFNKGRGGYIERGRFLERSNVRSYEIERDLKFSRCKKNC